MTSLSMTPIFSAMALRVRTGASYKGVSFCASIFLSNQDCHGKCKTMVKREGYNRKFNVVLGYLRVMFLNRQDHHHPSTFHQE